MQKISKRLFLFAALLGLVLSITGCKKNNEFSLNLSFEYDKYELNVDETVKLVPIAQFGELLEEDKANLVWTSYNEEIAVVNNGEVTAVANGTTYVKVAWADKPYISTMAKIQVGKPVDMPEAKVSVEGLNNVIYIGDKANFKYTLVHENENVEMLFASSDENVATVDVDGNIEFVGKGNVVLTAQLTHIENSNKYLEYTFEYTVKDYLNITYELNGGELPEDAITKFKSEEGATLPTPTKEGYAFGGWYRNSTLKGEVVTTIDKDATRNYKFFAKWLDTKAVVVENIDETATYKLGMYQANKKQTLFLTGLMDGYYGETTQDFYAGADVNLVTVEGGYNIKLTLADESVLFMNLIASGKFINIQFAEEPVSIWTYNKEYNTYTTLVNEKEYYVGTYSNFNTFSASTIDKAKSSFVAHFYEAIAYTDDLKAQDQLNEIEIAEKLAKDLELPVIENVKWSLPEKYAAAEINDGVLTVTRPEEADGDAVIKLIATCTVNDAILSKEFEVIILAKSNVILSMDFANKATSGYANEKAITVVDSLSGAEIEIIAHQAQTATSDADLHAGSGAFAVLCPTRKNNTTMQSYIQFSFEEAVNKVTFDATWWSADDKKNHAKKVTKFEVQYSADGETWTSIDLGSVNDLDATLYQAFTANVVNAKYVRIYVEADKTYTGNQNARIVIDNLKFYK